MRAQQRRVHHEPKVHDDRRQRDEPEGGEGRDQGHRRQLGAAGISEQAQDRRIERAETRLDHGDASDQTPSEDAGAERQQLPRSAQGGVSA